MSHVMKVCHDMNVCHDMKFDSCYLIKDKNFSPQISLMKCVYMTNTLYLMQSNHVFQYFSISVFLIIKYNIDSDFCLYHITI